MHQLCFPYHLSKSMYKHVTPCKNAWHIIKRPCTWYRLQLKRGLCWYRHYPKMHEMVSDRSSRADFWTNLRQISLRVFFALKKWGKMSILSKKTHKQVVVREKKYLRSYMPHTKVGQNKCSDIIYSNLIDLIIDNW